MSLQQGGRPPIFSGGRTTEMIAADIMASEDPAQSASNTADWIVANSESVTLAGSRLNFLRDNLRKQLVPEPMINETVEATKRPDITTAANDMRRAAFLAKVLSSPGLTIPDMFSRDAIEARVSQYNVDDTSAATHMSVLDTMVAMSARPAEMASLQFVPGGVVGYAKSRGHEEARAYAGFLSSDVAQALLEWTQNAIEDGTIEAPAQSSVYRRELAKVGLKPGDLRKIGAEYAVAASAASTDAGKNYVRRMALRHADADRPPASDHYAVVRRR